MVEGLLGLCLVPYVTDKVPSSVRESAARTFDSPGSNIDPSQNISDRSLLGDKLQESDPHANTASTLLVWSATSSLFGLSSITDSTSTKSGVSLYRVDEDPTMTLLPAITMFLKFSESVLGQNERQ